MARKPRHMITLDCHLLDRIRVAKAYAGKRHAFSKFLVHLIELGLAKLDDELADGMPDQSEDT